MSAIASARALGETNVVVATNLKMGRGRKTCGMSELAKSILVVGGNSGIGLRVVERLSAAGHSLTVAVRNRGALEAMGGLSLQHFDAEDRGASLELPDTLDAVIYLPGTISLKPFHRLTEDEFQRDMEVNFMGAVRVLQQALPALKRAASGSGAVVLFGSVAATTGMPFHASIGSAKAAVEGLARSLAAELAPAVRVNAVAPSLTDTPLASSLLSSEERAAAAAKRHPLNRVGDAGEVAELVEFLVSDASRFITGQVIGIDGGMSTVRQF
jgi:3-oxoacyl-[acyl-carrier protein] reductase